MPNPRISGRSVWDQPLVKAHITCMISAVGTSSLFLVCYLVYHYYAGSYPFPQGGFLRVLYLSILLSHTVLATASVPLILITLIRAWRGDLARTRPDRHGDLSDLAVRRRHRRRHLLHALPPADPGQPRPLPILIGRHRAKSRMHSIRNRTRA